MACNRPLYRFACLPEWVPASFQRRVRNGGLVVNREDRDYLVNVAGKRLQDFVSIPCGSCSGCRLEYSRQWAIRCVLESKYHKNNYFITLTYDDEHLPQGLLLDLETGEIERNCRGEFRHCLKDDDLTKFMKRLRITAERDGLRESSDIRFYACGEYGENFLRPHFHVILFGMNFPDLEVDFKYRGNTFYRSKWLEKIWGKGNVEIGDCTFESCAYVARYVMKKRKGQSAKEQKLVKRTILFNGQEMSESEFRDEFVRMSRKPGIAREYFDEHKDGIYETDEIYLQTSKKLQKVKPCRYYDTLYDIDNPERMQAVKQQRRKIAEERSKSLLDNTSLSEKEYFELRERSLQDKVKKLKRSID